MTADRVHVPYYPPPVQKAGTQKAGAAKNGAAAGESFAQVLEKTRASGGLNFSAHARQRLQARSIELGPEEVGKLEQAVEKAAAKGCRSSLLLYRDMAFVAGVPNRTIITALDSQSMKEHVFTNIDSAVVVD